MVEMVIAEVMAAYRANTGRRHAMKELSPKEPETPATSAPHFGY
jgi:hypothetical protein